MNDDAIYLADRGVFIASKLCSYSRNPALPLLFLNRRCIVFAFYRPRACH
jgi:hypothetical protein